MNLSDLQRRFGLDDRVRFEAGPGGLTRIAVSTPLAEAHIYTHGAHVAHWQPAGHEPVLFMSGKSWFEPGKPLRGGVPVCWPWFGPRPGQPQAPNHGLARLQDWTVESLVADPAGAVTLTLRLEPTELTRAAWPHAFVLRHVIAVGRTLSMSLETRNAGNEPFTISEALHTYLHVADVRAVRVDGLQNTPYLSSVEGDGRDGDEPITIAAETDRLYFGTPAPCTLHDEGLARRITVAKSGSASTVVWNPWVAKSRAMPDFGDDEWPGMICIETANAGPDAVAVAPGRTHRMSAILSVENAG